MNENNKNNSFNKMGFSLFLGTTFFSSFWGIYFLVNHEIDLGEMTPSVATELASDTFTEQEQASPWLSTDQLISHGSKLYKAQCALCHGAEGLGDGTPGIVPAPRNFVEGQWTKGGTPQELFTTLQNGIEGGSMVSYKHLPKLDRWALVHYIRSITENKITFNEQELEDFAKQAL